MQEISKPFEGIILRIWTISILRVTVPFRNVLETSSRD